MVARLLALSLIGLATAAVAAADPQPRQPTSKWVVDFDDAQCVASRDYGTKDDPLILALKAPPIGDVMQLALVRPGGGGKYAEHRQAKIGLDGAGSIETTMIAFAVPETEQRLFRINLQREQFDRVSKARTIRIEGRGEIDERLVLTQMEPLLKVMANCTADLRKVWNVHEGESPNPNLKEPTTGKLTGLFRGDDYPAIAIERALDGTVQFALLIDETGKVADCTVIATSGVAALDAQSCGIVKQRAQFKPAVGLDGKPAKNAVVQRVTWKIAD